VPDDPAERQEAQALVGVARMLRDLEHERAVVEAVDRLDFLRAVGNPEPQVLAHGVGRRRGPAVVTAGRP